MKEEFNIQIHLELGYRDLPNVALSYILMATLTVYDIQAVLIDNLQYSDG